MSARPFVLETAKHHLEEHKTGQVVVAGTSMVPLLHPGDRLRIRQVPVGRLRPGDIVVVEASGTLVVHRLLRQMRRSGDVWLLTRGVARYRADPPWPANGLLGRVDEVERQGKAYRLKGWRWAAVSRMEAAAALVEVAVCSALERRWPSAVTYPGLLTRWAFRAVRAPGWLLRRATGFGAPPRRVALRELRAFLYACLRRDHEAIERACQDTFAHDEAWGALLQESRRCGLASLLYKPLVAHRHTVPTWILDELRRHQVQAAGHRLILSQELQKLLEAFHRSQVPVLVVKGAAMEGTVHSLEDGRPTSDLDLVLQEQDLGRAADVLRSAGYVPRPPRPRAKGSSQVPMTWFDQRHNVPVELHTTLLDIPLPFRIIMARLWREAIIQRVGESQALVLRPEDLLMHVALHASFGHAYNTGLLWLEDISRILSAYGQQLDWRRFVATVKEAGMGAAVYWPLAQARELLGTPVPPEVLEGLAPGFLARWATRRLVNRLTVRPSLKGRRFDEDPIAAALYRQLIAGPWVSLPARLRIFGHNLFFETAVAAEAQPGSPTPVLQALASYARPAKLRRGLAFCVKAVF